MHRSLTTAACLSALITSVASDAGDWRLTPRFSVDQTFTDNVRQIDVDTSDDFITRVTPGVSLRGESARISSNVDYNFQRSLYVNNPNFDDGSHQLQGNTDVELIKQRVFVNTNSSMSQQLTNNQGLISRNQNARNGNRSDVMRFQVGPTVRERLGSWAVATFDYSFDQLTFKDDASGNSGGVITTDFGQQNDSTENSYQFGLSSGPEFARTPMNIGWSSRTIDRGEGLNESFESIDGDISFVFNRKFRATFSAGSQNNDFRTSQTAGDGFNWSIGGTWTPSQRTSISGNWGQQFFGDSFNVAVDHRHRRWVFTLNYDEALRTGNDIQRGVLLVPLEDGFGNPIFDPFASSLFDVPLDTPSIRNEASVSKNLRISTTYDMRRSSIRASFSNNTEQFQLSGIEENIKLLDIVFSHTLSVRTSVSLQGTWRAGQQSRSSGGDVFSITSSLNYLLGPHTSARLNYSYADQGAANTGRPGYTENSVVAGLVFHF